MAACPNHLLENVRRTAGAAQRGRQYVYYPDETSAALKASVLQALSDQVEARIEQNRRFFDGLDGRGQEALHIAVVPDPPPEVLLRLHQRARHPSVESPDRHATA